MQFAATVVNFIVQFLADRTAGSMIGSCHDDIVCLSVCLSVMLHTVHYGAQGRQREVESYTVVFLAEHFLFTSSDTFAIGYTYTLATKCDDETQRSAKKLTGSRLQFETVNKY